MKFEEVLKKINNNPYEFAEKHTVSTLEKILRKLSYHYYNTKEPLVSDDVFDIMKDELEKKDSSNNFLKEIGAPISKDKVKLPYSMGSLNKIKPDTGELEKFINKFPGKKVLSDKLDGNSALLVKNKGLKLYSRGDGFDGQDISHLIAYVIPNKVRKLMPENSAVRGELIISKNNFTKLQQKVKAKNNKNYANARNTVAGLVNSKTYPIEVAESTDFIAYSIIHPSLKFSDQMIKMNEYGFNVVWHKTCEKLTNTELSNLLQKRRSLGEYEIDGIVVFDSEKKHHHVSGNPTYGFAFKQVLTDQVAEVKVKHVEWNVSKDGYLKPRVFIEPVKLLGVEINKATGHNAAFIRDNVIGPGAVIKIIRSGDVIPYIAEVIKPSISKKPQMPEQKYKWNKTKIDIIVDNKENIVEIQTKVLTYFFEKMNVKYISKGIIKKLVQNGITNVIEWVKVNRDQLAKIDGIGIKSVKKIDDSFITALKEATLYQLMAATNLFGRNLGSKKIKLIIQEYPNILKLKDSNEELFRKVKNLDGFDDILANQFINHLNEYKKFHNELTKLVNINHLNNNIVTKNSTFKGITFVFTGYRNKDWEKKIEEGGGKVTGSVSKNTNIIIYTDTSSSKYKKAVELKQQDESIKILTPDEAKKLFI